MTSSHRQLEHFKGCAKVEFPHKNRHALIAVSSEQNFLVVKARNFNFVFYPGHLSKQNWHCNTILRLDEAMQSHKIEGLVA